MKWQVSLCVYTQCIYSAITHAGKNNIYLSKSKNINEQPKVTCKTDRNQNIPILLQMCFMKNIFAVLCGDIHILQDRTAIFRFVNRHLFHSRCQCIPIYSHSGNSPQHWHMLLHSCMDCTNTHLFMKIRDEKVTNKGPKLADLRTPSRDLSWGGCCLCSDTTPPLTGCCAI